MPDDEYYKFVFISSYSHVRCKLYLRLNLYIYVIVSPRRKLKILFGSTSRPSMVEYILAREAKFRIKLQHVGNKIANALANIVPVGLGKLIYTG